MIDKEIAPSQTGELEAIVNWGRPPTSLKSSKEKAATFELSLDTEMIVDPTIRRCEELPLPTVGIKPGAVGAIDMDMPAAKVRSLLLVQYIWPLGPLITTLENPIKETLEDKVSVPLIVRIPDWPVNAVALMFAPEAIV